MSKWEDIEIARVRHQAQGLCYMEFQIPGPEVYYCLRKATWAVMLGDEAFQMCDKHRTYFHAEGYDIPLEEELL